MISYQIVHIKNYESTEIFEQIRHSELDKELAGYVKNK